MTVRTSWCDKLASTGTVGLRLSPKFRPSAQILDAISPILTTEITPRGQGERVTFNIDKAEVFELVLTFRDGRRYTFAPLSLSVGFVHRAELLTQSAAAPTVRFTSHPEPFSSSVPRLSKALSHVYDLLGDQDRTVTQVGVVADTAVALEDAPPGLADLIQSTVSKWGESISFSFQIVAKLLENEEYLDRCIHTVSRMDDVEAVPTINLDWQRIFKKPKPALKAKAVNDLIDSCAEGAIDYFERLAEGIQDD
jgi:hypothetical protein